MRKAFVFIVSLLCWGAIWSQQWIGVSADAGIAWQLDKMPETKTKLGGGGGIGFVYQFQLNHFILETGLEGKFTYNPVGVADSLLHFNMIDTKGTPFVYNGYLKDRIDASKNLSVSLPLMLGVEYNYFYGLVGAILYLVAQNKRLNLLQLETMTSTMRQSRMCRLMVFMIILKKNLEGP